MAYQYVREPLTAEDVDMLCQACNTLQEKLIIWVLLDTGLRVSELCSLTPHHNRIELITNYVVLLHKRMEQSS